MHIYMQVPSLIFSEFMCETIGMEKYTTQKSTKSKPLSSGKNVLNPARTAPNWQSSVDENSSKSIQALTPPALDSKLLHKILDKLPGENEIVSLSELSAQFSQFLPLRVKIVTGFCAENDMDPTLDLEDIYNIHFSKRTEVVSICDITGAHYSIPMYSSLQFGVIYDPENEARFFSSVTEIINAKPLPKAVVAMEQYTGHNKKPLFIANELLLVQSISKHGGGLKRPSLNVYSISSSAVKDIPSDCVARFSTAPWLTKMYLSDMMEYMHDPLPCKARLYFDDSTSSLPEHLYREIVTIEEKHTNSSFLISLELERHRKGRQTEVKDLIDIPTCIGVDVHILSPFKAMKRYQKLYENTARLLKEFNPTKVQACVDAPSDDIYVTQAQLLAQCRRGYENVGFNIETSTIIGEYQPLLQAAFDPAPQYEELDIIHSTANKVTKEPPHSVVSAPLPPVPKKPPLASKTQYEELDIIHSNASKVTKEPPHSVVSTPPPPVPKKPPLGSKTQDNTQTPSAVESGQTFRKPPSTRDKVALSPPVPGPRTPQPGSDKIPLPPAHNKSPTALKSKSFSQNMKNAVVKSKPSPPAAPPATAPGLSSLETTISQLSNRLHAVEKQLSLVTTDVKSLKAINGLDAGDYSSLQSLSLLTRDDVLNLLDHLNLPQYKDRFRQEMVDGEILSEIDEVVLEQELGMTSRIHRLRLMKYIESLGQESTTHT